jgi:hypothetical protein
MRAFQRHSVDLVVFGNRLAVDAIDLTALDAIARRAVGHVEANLAVLDVAGTNDTTGGQGELQITLPEALSHLRFPEK